MHIYMYNIYTYIHTCTSQHTARSRHTASPVVFGAAVGCARARARSAADWRRPHRAAEPAYIRH